MADEEPACNTRLGIHVGLPSGTAWRWKCLCGRANLDHDGASGLITFTYRAVPVQ